VPDDPFSNAIDAIRDAWRFQISSVNWTKESMEIRGWCRTLAESLSGEPFIEARSARIVHCERYGLRRDVAAIFQVEPESISSFRAELVADEDAGSVLVSPRWQDEGVGQNVRLANSWMIPSHEHGVVLPPSENVDRVTGRNTTSAFVYGGATHCYRLVQALRSASGLEAEHFQNIVDWGCGAGRILQNLTKVWPGKVVGVDVDPKNVAWCQQNLAGVTVSPVDWQPPTSLGTDSFDLLFAFSVFSHIGRSRQDKWLDELKRLVAPGGFLVLTTLGLVSTASRRPGPKFFAHLEQQGFVEWSNHSQLLDVKPGREAYVNIAMTEKFARELFGRHFAVRGVFPGLGPQDAWVLQSE
jgi:SAM-dependent methyltransferase